MHFLGSCCAKEWNREDKNGNGDQSETADSGQDVFMAEAMKSSILGYVFKKRKE